MSRVNEVIQKMNAETRAVYEKKATKLGISLEDHVGNLLEKELDEVSDINAGTADHYNGYVADVKYEGTP